MTAIDLLLTGLVLAAMTAIAVVDARRMIVDPRLVLALVGAGLLWRLFGSADTGSLWNAALGAALGVAVVAAPIALAHWRRRPWPLFPGDAMMLGGLGFVLGPLGLGWSLLAGSGFGLLYRLCLQRRRGRPIHRGYCPLGPGMVAGAICVFLFVNAGGSLADDGASPSAPLHPQPHAAASVTLAPLHPGPVETGGGTAMLAATEIAPVRVPLPAELAAREIAVDEAGPLSFAHATGRIATLSGARVEVEERPSRVAGGAVFLPDPPELSLVFEGRLPGFLNQIAAYAGYDWTWQDGAIVFYRHWDIEQRTPEVPAAASVEVEESRPAVWPVPGSSTGHVIRHCGRCSRTGPRGRAGPWSGSPSAATPSAPTHPSPAVSWMPSIISWPRPPRAGPCRRSPMSPTAIW